jgi:hypothetical protein
VNMDQKTLVEQKEAREELLPEAFSPEEIYE